MQIDLNMGQVVLALIMFLGGLVINNLRTELGRLDASVKAVKADVDASLKTVVTSFEARFTAFDNQRIVPLERSTSNVSDKIGEISKDIIRSIASLQLDFTKTHPTKADLEAFQSGQNMRLSQIEDDVRRIAEQLIPRDMLEIREKAPGRRR